METAITGSCSAMEGTLPGKCASLVFPYVPMQPNDPERYQPRDGLCAGTLFPGLNMPFFKQMKSRMNCDNAALCELMALDFAITELGLYLDTHREDQEALRLFQNYVSLAQEGRRRYEEMYGPLTQEAVTGTSWSWLNDPWPWEKEGGGK